MIRLRQELSGYNNYIYTIYKEAKYKEAEEER